MRKQSKLSSSSSLGCDGKRPLEAEVRRLVSEVWSLGRRVEEALVQPVEILRQRVPQGSESYIAFDHEVKKRRFFLEMECIAFIVGQQPRDGDLRAVTAVLEIVTELEYIGAYVANIAETQLLIARLDETLSGPVADIHRLAEMVRDMLRRAMEGFGLGDLDLVRKVHADDDDIDALYASVHGELLNYVVGKPHRLVKQARYMAQIARDLERTADRVTNICEWVVFSETGRLGKDAIPGREDYENAIGV
jgi:phosphate transport system protein